MKKINSVKITLLIIVSLLMFQSCESDSLKAERSFYRKCRYRIKATHGEWMTSEPTPEYEIIQGGGIKYETWGYNKIKTVVRYGTYSIESY